MPNNLQEIITGIEEKLELQTFTYKGVEIWPLIRISILLSRPKTNKELSFSVFKKLQFLVLGLNEFIKWKCGLWPQSKNVFLTSSHYKVKENAVVYDRIINPFLGWLQSRGEDYVVFEFTNNYSYEENLSYRKKSIRLQPVIYLLSFFWKTQFLFTNREIRLKGNLELFNRLANQYNLNFRIDKNFKRRLFLLEKQSLFLEKILRKMSASHVGMVCYYDFKSLALTWASNRLKIESVDFQHGVQGPSHPAYGNWKKSITKNSKFIPTHFWVWDEFSYNNLKKWKNPKGIVFGCNKWIQDRIKSSSLEILLYTCQPLENPFPDEFITLIKNYDGLKKWYIRLHPHQVGQMGEFELFFKKLGLKDKVNLKEATALPLTDLLARTCLHITKFSSVAIEASYYNIPTLFVDDYGMDLYKNQISKELLFHFKEGFVMEDLLEKISVTEDFYTQNEKTVNRFENIGRFFHKHDQ